MLCCELKWKFYLSKDIADISQVIQRERSDYPFKWNGAVEVAIYKEGDGNTVAVAHAVEDRIQGIMETLPEGMKLEKFMINPFSYPQQLMKLEMRVLLGVFLQY